MNEPINKEEPRVLQYRKQVKFVTLPSQYLAFFSFLFFIGTTGYYLFSICQGRASIDLKLSALRLGATWLILYLQYRFLMKPLATSKIQVFKDRLLIRCGEKKTVILFEDIEAIKSAVQINLGGWFKLALKNGKSYRFTVVLERVDYIIDAVMAFNPALMPQKDYQALRTGLILADHGLARFYSFFGPKYRWITLSHVVVLPTAFAALLAKDFGHVSFLSLILKIYVVIAFLSSIAVIITNVLIDKPIKQRLLNNPKNKIRDTAYEQSIYRRVFPAYILSVIAVFTVIYRFDLHALVRVQAHATHPSSELWVDTRFNCVNCSHPLHLGDHVVFTFEGNETQGVLVGLPGETLHAPPVSENNRAVASLANAPIPRNKIAIRDDRQKIQLVGLEQIEGLALSELSSFIFPRRQ